MNEKILIIDDERNILETLEYMLTKKASGSGARQKALRQLTYSNQNPLIW